MAKKIHPKLMKRVKLSFSKKRGKRRTRARSTDG